ERGGVGGARAGSVPTPPGPPRVGPAPAVLHRTEEITPARWFRSRGRRAANTLAWATPPDGRLLLATGSGDRTVRVWDGHTGALLHALRHTGTGRTGWVLSVGWAVLPDGRLLLATGGWDP